MKGGMGGSQDQSIQLPAWLDSASQQVSGRALQQMDQRFMPYEGPSVAAFTPMQHAAFQGANQAAQAFGLPAVHGNAGGGLDGMGRAENFGGVMGYSPYAGFQQAQNRWQNDHPTQAADYAALFGDTRGGRSQGGNGGGRGGNGGQGGGRTAPAAGGTEGQVREVRPNSPGGHPYREVFRNGRWVRI